jgi:hypothetical protein
VEIILVDIDFTDADDIENLLNTTAVYAGEEVSELKHILYQAFDEFYEEDTFYTLVGFNASWGGTDISSALSVVEEFIGDDTYVVQAAPNVSQHGVNWSSAIPNVINVGAWNVDQDNYFLAGQTSQLDNIDIYANGYIEDDILGANFGTSFAAPRVFAELLNWHETNVVPMLKSGELVITKTDLTASEETFVTNYLIDTLSTDIELSLVGDSNYYGPLNLLTATIDNNTLAPVVVPYSVVGLESQLNTYSLVIYNSHDLAGTVVSRGGGILSDVTIAADMSNPDDQLTDISSNIGTFAMEVDNGASVSLLADMIHTNASPTKAITPQDALEALRLSVGLTTIGGSKTALDFMAADFNQNGKVTPQDALDILKYSVGLRELDTDWMFVDSAGDYSGITKGDVSFTEGVSIADMSADASVGLTGILLGDVNDTYTSYLDSSGTMV